MLKNLEKRGNKGIDECKIDSNGKRGHSEMIAEPAVVADSGNDESSANRERHIVMQLHLDYEL
jgi:hypothetical protein